MSTDKSSYGTIRGGPSEEGPRNRAECRRWKDEPFFENASAHLTLGVTIRSMKHSSLFLAALVPVAVLAQTPNLIDILRAQDNKPNQPVTSAAVKREPSWLDPNGRPWPATARYLPGFPQEATGGRSRLTIDNTSGGSNVYVKLCRNTNGRCAAARHVFIPNGSSFTIKNIRAGTFDIRYRDLSTGALAESQPIILREIENEEGVRFSTVTLTLYKVRDGNTSFSPLDESRF